MNEHYPEWLADILRQICLSVILMRAGMELNFQVIGLNVLFFSSIPILLQIGAVAAVSVQIAGSSWMLGIANGSCFGAASLAIQV
jgi:hypothetical protein